MAKMAATGDGRAAKADVRRGLERFHHVTGLPTQPDAADAAPDAIYGLTVALGAWIGFYVPMLLSGVAWENRSWKLFGINAGYHLAALLAAAMILSHWR